MKKSPEEYTVSLRKINLDPYMVKQIVSNGLPAGVQNSVIAIANVVVQSNINSFGKLAVAAAELIPRWRASDSCRSPVFHGTDYFYQPEPWSQEIRPREKGRAPLESCAAFPWQKWLELLCILQVRF